MIEHHPGVHDVPASPASTRGRHAEVLDGRRAKGSGPRGRGAKDTSWSLAGKVRPAMLLLLLLAPLAVLAVGTLRQESVPTASMPQVLPPSSEPLPSSARVPSGEPLLSGEPVPAPKASPPIAAAPTASPPISPAMDASLASRVLADLDGWRSAALGAAERSMIEEYAIPGSAYAAEQERAVASLASAGLRPVGLSTKVVSVSAVAKAGANRWQVGVTDVRSAYQLLDASGVVRADIPASKPASWLVTLTADPGTSAEASGSRPSEASRWRIESVTRTSACPKGMTCSGSAQR